jgi:tetratricopeptide (TPR) repeat protein
MSVAVLAAVFAMGARAQDPLADAIAALQQNNFASAERILRLDLQTNARDGDACALLAVVLDQEKKYPEAEGFYRQAFALSGPNVALSNNYGNHLLALKRPKEAQLQFQKTVALDPANVNARVQLARLSLEQKSPAEALAHLNHLPADVQQRSDVVLMLAAALSTSGQYERAEKVFDHAAALQPDNFDAVYYGGLAASHAGHLEHAHDLLERALQLQSGNVDALYDAAVVDAKLGRGDAALTLLGRASRIDSQKPDVTNLLARLTAELGYFEDSLKAWDRYLQLKPNDSSALRERAYVKTNIPKQSAAGISELQDYLRNHAQDAVAHYELGVSESDTDSDSAAKEFAKSIQLKPEFAPARFARGLLLSRQGDPAAALKDFEFTAAREPYNVAVLDRLGETLLQLKRSRDAIETLRRASEIDPQNSRVLLHLAQALVKVGHGDEAKPLFVRARDIGPARPLAPHPAGLLDYLLLSPEEQLARYRAGVE